MRRWLQPPPGDFISAEQADLLRQQSIDLQEARSSLAIAEGETAFLRSQPMTTMATLLPPKSFHGVGTQA